MTAPTPLHPALPESLRADVEALARVMAKATAEVWRKQEAEAKEGAA